jgi:uncharacterized protein (TIGR02996 family)
MNSRSTACASAGASFDAVADHTHDVTVRLAFADQLQFEGRGTLRVDLDG